MSFRHLPQSCLSPSPGVSYCTECGWFHKPGSAHGTPVWSAPPIVAPPADR